MKSATFLLALLVATSSAVAAPKRLDDRGSPRSQVNVESRWVHSGEGLNPVGSSRVDLQACKLEYSIVSPK